MKQDLRTHPAQTYAPPVLPPTRRNETFRQFGIAAGVALVIVVSLTALFSLSGEETTEPPPDVTEPVAAAPTLSARERDCRELERVVSKPLFRGNPFFLIGIAEDPELAAILEAPAPWAKAPRVWRAVVEARVLCE